MDTEATDLSIDQATKAFADMIEPPEKEPEKVDTEVDPKVEVTPEPENNTADEGGDAIVIEVDGKQITLTKEQVAEAVKAKDDTDRKSKTADNARALADAETRKAQQERQKMGEQLQRWQAQLEGALEQQSKIDWDKLIAENPVGALQEQHLQQKRQAALQENLREQNRLAEQAKTEHQAAFQAHLQIQQRELLAKLPEWKDETRAKTEREALKAYLVNQGYEDSDVANINDHRAVILGRKAMLYDQMMAKAQAAAKKVANVPEKVVRPGVSQDRNPMDGRTAAMRNHQQKGTVESLAAAFAQIL